MVEMILADIEREQIGIDTGAADVVLMMEIFEHLAIDPMRALWEANRILKMGGRLIFTTPNAASRDNFFRILRGRSPWVGLEFSGFSTNRHNRLYDAPELQVILRQAGFDIERCESHSYRDVRARLRERIRRALLAVIDACGGLLGDVRPMREDWIFIWAIKVSEPSQRYPASLYFNESDNPRWYEALRRTRAADAAQRT